MKLIDAKIHNPNEVKDPTPFDLIKNYILSRYSSVIRIPINTIATGAAGAFFGMAKALYKDIPKGQLVRSHGFGALGMGLLYFSVNEIANGIVRRSIDREQLFYSNSVAGAVTNVATFAYLRQQNQTAFLNTFMKSIKYSWTLCVGAIMWDIYLVQMRHYFITNGLDNQKKEVFKINRIPSEGTRWLRMKEIEKLREEANMERYGTPQLTNVIFNSKDETMTFDQLKEQVKRHKEYLETQNMLSEDSPDSSIFSKPASTAQPEQQQQQQQQNKPQNPK